MSPDGNWIAFLDENANRLKKIAVSGGPPTIVGPALGATRGIVWDGNETIVLATSDTSTGVLRVPAAGGSPEVLTTPKAGEDHVYPFALPGKNAILFTLVTQAAPNQIILLNLDTRQETRLIANGSNARYSPSGHLLYVADGSLRAVAFDLNRLEVRGEAVPVVNEVATKGAGAGQVALSATGTLFYLHGKIEASARTLVWVDRLGREEPTGIPPNLYTTARLSPDGARVAVDTRLQRSAISTWDLSRRILTTVVVGPASSIVPLWSPDGRRIAFAAERDGSRNIWWQNADGTGSPERLTQGGQQQTPTAFTPDGKGLLMREPDGAPYDVGFADLTTGRHDLLLHASYNESNAVLSPNGKWLAYQSNESGQEEIYVRPFPNIEAGRWKLSTGGGTRPMWGRNGRELFFYLPPGKVLAVPVREGSTFSFDSPQMIIDGNYPAPNWSRQYDVSADGTRFLMLKNVADPQATPSQLVLVQNWFEELNRLVPKK